MKSTFLTLVVLFSLALTALAQSQPAAQDTTSLKGDLKAYEKEAIIQVMNVAKVTILKSSNQNTTEQNLSLLREIEYLVQIVTDRFKKEAPAPAADHKDKPKKQ